VSIAEQVGAPRIVRGGGIPYPAGDPELEPDAERAWRRRLVQRALDVVATPVERPTVFEVPMTNQPPTNQPPTNRSPANQPPANQPPANQPPAKQPVATEPDRA
jgi:glycine reductase